MSASTDRAIEQLIAAWQNLEADHVHAGEGNGSWNEDISSWDNLTSKLTEGIIYPEPNQFIRGLIPIPYVGDLRDAKVFYFTANPGYLHLDHYLEFKDAYYRDRLKYNLAQTELHRQDYPFFFLDPKLAHTGGYMYWVKKFEPLIEVLVSSGECDSREVAIKRIAQKVAVIELTGYRSDGMPPYKQFENHITHKKAFDLAQCLYCDSSRVTLIGRSPQYWGFNDKPTKKDHFFINRTKNKQLKQKDRQGASRSGTMNYPDFLKCASRVLQK